MLNKTNIVLAVTLAVFAVTPAQAAEGKKKKEVTSIVGYNVTETQTYVGPKADQYHKMDKNADGIVTFKEYRDFSNLENEYDAFVRMDKDGSKNISLEEYVDFNNTGKGETQVESELHGKVTVKGTNLKSRIIKNTYYVPVEPEIVSIEEVEPASE